MATSGSTVAIGAPSASTKLILSVLVTLHTAVDPDTRDRISAIYDGVRTAGAELIAGYTDAELAVIADLLDRGRAMQLRQAEWIGREQAGGPGE